MNSENSFRLQESFDKSQIWTLLRRNCSFMLLTFTIQDINVCLGVCKTWNRDIKSLLYSKCSENATQFINKNYGYVRLNKCFVNISRPQRHIGWYRINFTLECRPRSELQGKNIVLSHRYSLMRRPELALYSNYCFDCLDDSEVRSVWILHEESKHSPLPSVTLPMPILQVKKADSFRIIISFFSGDGLMDFSSLVWQPPIVTQRSDLYRYPGNLIDARYDHLRSSEIETMAMWRDVKYDPIRKVIPRDYLLPSFERVSVMCSGLDQIYIKAVFRATATGRGA